MMSSHLQRQNNPIAQQRARVGYILQTYPALTMTFIYREVLALEKAGFSITTFSVWKPAREQLSQEARDLMDSTYYIFPLAWPKFILAHLYFLFTRPAKYLGTALFVMTRKGESWKNRLRTVYHFGEAVYLAREIQKRGMQHVHAHFEINAASIALVLSRLLGISFSFTAHNIFFTDRILLKEKFREARFIVAISEFTRKFLSDLYPGEDRQKIHIVHCGLSPDDFVPPALKPINPIPKLLFVAQLVERKGAPVLVEACRILAERGLKFECLIIGDGPQRALVERQVAEYGLHGTVELAGAMFQEQLREYLGCADVFVLPCVTASNGDMDGVPVSLMEAMSMEIPVVSTFVSGIPELIQDGHSGLLVTEKDATALADALQRLMQDRELCAVLGKNGRQKIMQEFNVFKNADELTQLFGRYLSQ